jgi:hypothetical protein
MAKKLKRLTAANVIGKIDSFKDQWLHFTTADKRVRLVQVQSFEDKNFKVKDTQGHSLLLHLQDIVEIWQEIQG